uniref:K-box domain-containing protein n=1 Tax=Salix viminalis TaxID=40686 RepID=A0A6N2MNU4_SALVM
MKGELNFLYLMKMTRKNIQIKKIDNTAARLLSWCFLQLASFSSSTQTQGAIYIRRTLTDMSGQPSLELQLDGAVYAMLNKEIAEKTRELRGEDLQGLNLEELQKLEKSIETSLCRVAEEKVMDLSAAGQRPSDSYIRSMSSDDPRQEYNSPCAFLTLGKESLN